MNLRTGRRLAEFHQYVAPIESPKLSAFCVNFTGIAQSKIDNDGVPIQTCLMLFDKWVKEQINVYQLILPKTSRNRPQGNCALASWSDWDFSVCLHRECERKRVKKPAYFNQWIDIKAIYKKWFKYNPLNFCDALHHVGIAFAGREHSGIDDAKNLATLISHMFHDGTPFFITKDLMPFMMFNKNS